MLRLPFLTSHPTPPALLQPSILPIEPPPRRERIGLTEREWAAHRARQGLEPIKGSTYRCRVPWRLGREPRGAQVSRVQSMGNPDGSVTWFYWVRN